MGFPKAIFKGNFTSCEGMIHVHVWGNCEEKHTEAIFVTVLGLSKGQLRATLNGSTDTAYQTLNFIYGVNFQIIIYILCSSVRQT